MIKIIFGKTITIEYSGTAYTGYCGYYVSNTDPDKIGAQPCYNYVKVKDNPDVPTDNLRTGRILVITISGITASQATGGHDYLRASTSPRPSAAGESPAKAVAPTLCSQLKLESMVEKPHR